MPNRQHDILEQRWVRWVLYVAFWTALGVFNAVQMYEIRRMSARPIPFDSALLIGLSDWYCWALLAPLVYWLCRRFPFEQRAWLYSLLAHSVFNLVCMLLVVAAVVPIMQFTRPAYQEPKDFMDWYQYMFLAEFVAYLWIYWSIVGVSHAYRYYRKYRERELRTAQLEGQLAQAQLQALKMQLQPHFLFNTLNAISALMHKDPRLADRMMARLGEMLRRTLETIGVQEVSFRQEMEFVEPYLEIEKTRIGPRLQVSFHVDPYAMDALVPNLVLQPLVENAIRHGIAPYPESGRIDIRAETVGNVLRLQVQDDGPGLTDVQLAEFHEGVGLSNTRARLRQLYGDQHRFEFQNTPGAGLAVTLTLPFRVSSELAPPPPAGAESQNLTGTPAAAVV